MNSPRVSVIIPAYNQGAYLAQAVDSVLAQTYPDWELLIVDDGSTDDTAGVAARYSDARIRLVSQANRGLPGARNTGIAQATGEYLAFLDADDAFLPEKLELQVRRLDQEPELGLSFAGRIEVDAGLNPAWFLRAPDGASLEDLVMGFPFTINDLLVRRAWVERVGGFDESFRLHSEDRDFYLRLALAGCRFGQLNRFVAYRRLHARRVFDQVQARIETMHRALETCFSHPDCPPGVAVLRRPAYARVYLTWAFQEFAQGQEAAAQEHLLEAVSLDPSILQGDGDQFIQSAVWFSVRDGGDHVEPLCKILAGLPVGFHSLAERLDGALARGYLIRGMRAVIWGRLEEAETHFAQASRLGGRFDGTLRNILSEQIASYAVAFGAGPAQQILRRLAPFLKRMGGSGDLRWLEGFVALNQAFQSYRRGQFKRVPGSVLRAVLRNPSHLANRGVISIFTRSLVEIVR